MKKLILIFLMSSTLLNAETVKDLCLSWDSSCPPTNNTANENTIRARLDNLLPSQSKGTMRLWFASYNKTIYYKVKELKTNQPAYLTLFKISPNNELRAVVQNQAIKVWRIYNYQDKSITGKVYFKTVVTSREIPSTQWFSLIDAKNPRQLKSILCVQSLTIGSQNPDSEKPQTTTVDNKIYRTALVIGNADYLKSPLNAPVLDAQALAKVLRKLGFQVTEKINLDRKGMQNAIRAFGRKLKQRPGVGLFYYSRHGIQDKDTNYLIPIGATQSLQEAFDLPYETVLVN